MITRPELWRDVLSPADLARPLSPGWVTGKRLCVGKADGEFFFASGSRVYDVKVRKILPVSDTLRESESQKAALADDFLVPVQSGGLRTSVNSLRDWPSHRAEIVSVASARDQFAAIDGFGTALVGRFDRDVGCTASYALPPVGYQGGSEGWSGVCFHPDAPSQVVTARYWHKTATLYDGEVPLRTTNTIQYPTSLAFLEQSIMLTEGRCITAWDTRVSAPVVRKTVGLRQLYAIAIDKPGNTIVVSGADRVVYSIDPRTFRVRSRWTNCLKYECVHVSLSETQKGVCFVGGIDNEFACGIFDEAAPAIATNGRERMMSGAVTTSPRRLFGFRADDRWAGLCGRGTDRDETVGVSLSGALYFVEANLSRESFT